MLLVKREVGTMGLLGTGSTTCRHRKLIFGGSVLVKKELIIKEKEKHEMIDCSADLTDKVDTPSGKERVDSREKWQDL